MPGKAAIYAWLASPRRPISKRLADIDRLNTARWAMNVFIPSMTIRARMRELVRSPIGGQELSRLA